MNCIWTYRICCMKWCTWRRRSRSVWTSRECFFYQEAFRQFVINSFTKVVPIILKPVHWFSYKIFFIFIKKRRTYLECVLHPKVKNLLMSLCMNFKVSPHIQGGMTPLSINSTKWSVTLKQFVDIRRLLTILWGWRLKG